MNGEQNENNKPEKKNKAAIIGFILSGLLFITSLTEIYDLVFFFTMWIYGRSILLFFLICFLLASPGIIFSIFGFRQKKQRIFAWLGLSIGIFCSFVVLPVRHITFIPGNSLPHALEDYKFRKACPKGCFWLDYDKGNIISMISRNTGILICFGEINYQGKPGSYLDEDIIQFAEKNGWKYHLTVSLTNEDFVKFFNRSFTKDDIIPDIIACLDDYCPTPLWIKQDCNILVFETENSYGLPSFVMITKDGSKLSVRHGNPALPDGTHGFILYPGFYDLSETQKENQLQK